MKDTKKKVYVGMSGGVDSSTSAALLLNQGYDVTGVFIKIWQPEFIECTWREDRLDALRVSAHLGIPFREIDLSCEYKESVISNMLDMYARGQTPNPDVLCNEKIKFGFFSDWAFRNGADYVATGHYAQVLTNDTGSYLCRGNDMSKDQSYFLYRMSESTLARTLFPIGHLPKAEVRNIAKKMNLPVAFKPDSQGLCFVGDVTLKDFLGRYTNLTEGIVLDTMGQPIGIHSGASQYTRGQRHGFTIGGEYAQKGSYYVIETDTQSNTIVVSNNKKDAERLECILTTVHWIQKRPEVNRPYWAQVRYHDTPIKISLLYEHNLIRCIFTKPLIVAQGQSLVVYDDEVCLGGGIISF